MATEPPKTPDSARDVHLPPFLITQLMALLGGHDHDLVFTGTRDGLLRRSSMARRVFGPAVNGNPDRGVPPVIAGMHLHDLRRTSGRWSCGSWTLSAASSSPPA